MKFRRFGLLGWFIGFALALTINLWIPGLRDAATAFGLCLSGYLFGSIFDE